MDQIIGVISLAAFGLSILSGCAVFRWHQNHVRHGGERIDIRRQGYNSKPH